jgi:hypothetical protein
MPLPKLSRRSFVSLLGLGAVMAALPWVRAEAKTAMTLTGHVRELSKGEYVFSRDRYHCDYCYTGPASSVYKISSAVPLTIGTNITLRGTVRGDRFICS